MTITENTTLSELVRNNPSTIEALATLHRAFGRLKNPLLRQIFGFITIKKAARIFNKEPRDFFRQLAPLGFVTTDPSFCLACEISEEEVERDFDRVVDLRLRKENDTTSTVLHEIEALKKHETLLLITKDEPTYFIFSLEKQAFGIELIHKEKELVYTYFTKQ